MAAADPLGAFITRATDARPRTSEGPLAGTPFAVKDNIDTADLPTTGGTPALQRSRPRQDHPAVARLRAAGAHLVGKTNLHELAFGITSNNAAFGPVRNPVDPLRSAGGSSGGSAVTVATGEVPFALATDTGGSATIPAAWCGVVGFRPTTGRYGSGHCVPLSATRDTVGVIAESVAVLRQVDEVLAERPPADPPQQVRLGLPTHGYLFPLEHDVDEVWSATLDLLSSAGVELVPVHTSGLHELEASCGLEIVLHEVVRDLTAYLHELPDGAPTLREVVDQIASPDVAHMMLGAVEQPVSLERYEECLAIRDQFRAAFTRAFESSRADALIYPTVPVTATPLGHDLTTPVLGREQSVFHTVTRNTLPGSDAGQPVVTLPAGRGSLGLPVGISLEAREGEDDRLLALAAYLEKVLAVADS